MRKKLPAYAILGLFFALPPPAGAAPAAPAKRFEIGLIGDLPYSAEDEAKFPALREEMNAAPLAFVVHVGDVEWDPRAYKSAMNGMPPCAGNAFEKRREIFDGFKHPFIITPGDNDWTDCHHAGPGLDPLERLKRFREVFHKGDKSLGARAIPLARQGADPKWAKFRENARWAHGGVLFLTLHAVGSNNNLGRKPEGDEEHAERNAAGIAWLKDGFALAKRDGLKGVMVLTQANPYFEDRWAPKFRETMRLAPLGGDPSGFSDLLAALEAEALAFGKPVAFVHGDSRYFRVDQPLFSSAQGRLIESFTRVEVFGSPNIHWVRAIIDPGAPRVFSFQPELVRKNVVNHGY